MPTRLAKLRALLSQFESTTNSAVAVASPSFNLSPSTNVEFSNSSSRPFTTTGPPPPMWSPPSQTRVVSAVFHKPKDAKRPCRSTECHELVSSFAASAYTPHVRSQMHNFGTKSRTMTNRRGGMLFSDRAMHVQVNQQCVLVPIYVDGNKCFEIENCLSCGSPHDTNVVRRCTQHLLVLDTSAHVAAGQKIANRDGDDNAKPKRQPRVAPVANLRDAPWSKLSARVEPILLANANGDKV